MLNAISTTAVSRAEKEYIKHQSYRHGAGICTAPRYRNNRSSHSAFERKPWGLFVSCDDEIAPNPTVTKEDVKPQLVNEVF